MTWEPRFLDAHQGTVWARPGTGPMGKPALTLDLTNVDVRLVSLPVYAVEELRAACDEVIAQYAKS